MHRKYIKENPMYYVELMKDKSRKPTREKLKFQSKENLRRINSVLNEDHPLYLPFHIGLHCEIHVGEVCGLEWKHIYFEEMILEVEQQLVGIKDDNGKIQWQPRPPKTKAGYRTIPFGNALAEILRRAKRRQLESRLKFGEFYKQDQNMIIYIKENGEHCTPSVIKYNTSKISETLNISFNYHSLRHTHATILIEYGSPVKTVQKRLGHSRAAVTEDRYVHLTEKMARDAANIFDSFAQDI